MLAYIARRLLLVVPTLFGIMLANFIIVQAAPGGPVDLMLARLRGHAGEATARVASTGVGESGRAARGVGEEGATRASQGDRKSTRLNSSHVKISYAVFCLKKKKRT